MKLVLDQMILDYGVELLLHGIFVDVDMNERRISRVQAVGKSGRIHVTAATFVDSTGDGDVFASAGAPFDGKMDVEDRASMLALTFRIGNIDIKKYLGFRDGSQPAYTGLLKELESLRGFTMLIRAFREDMIWVNNNIPNLSGLRVEDLTWLEVDGRKRMRITHDFLKRKMPGFEDSFIVDTASQLGVRCSRRLTGAHVVTTSELQSGIVFPDTVVMGPDFRHDFSDEHPHWHVPYRSLVPRNIKNVLATGRCISADPIANDLLAPIQYCFATGQAAGTAAAIAVKDNVTAAQVDVSKLQKRLIEQNVLLPDEITNKLR